MRRIRNARTAHASRWTARETSCTSVCFECYSNTWEQYFFVAFGPVHACTHITHTQCGSHKFLTIFKFISGNFKLQRAISRTSSCICFSLFPSPLGLCVRFGGEKETEPSQEKQSLAKVFPQRKQENMLQLAYLLATYYYLACKWPKVVASSRKWSKVM